MEEIESTLLVDLACQAIKKDIYNKNLIPGKKINPKDLSERYNISVTPIKLALNRLVVSGLVECKPRRGMIVKVLTEDDIIESAQARKMIELFCVPSAIRVAQEKPDFLHDMKDILINHENEINKAYSSGDFIELQGVDFNFHQMIIQTMNNSIIEEMYNNVGMHFKIAYLYGKKALHRTNETLEEHKKIYEALADGSEIKLSKAISEHINNVTENYIHQFPSIVNESK